MFRATHLKEDCQSSFDDAEACLKTCQKVAGSLRRAIMDMKKLRRALNKMRKSEKTRKALNAKAMAAADGDSENRMAKCLGGRTALSKAVTMSDPLILQQFKEVLGKKEMRVVKEPANELLSGMHDATYPFCVRRGRHVLKYLVKPDEKRAVLERTVGQFKEKCLKDGQDKNLPLGLDWKDC